VLSDNWTTSGEDGLIDRLQRPIRDLRISVTDRCNFRCGYCMPRVRYPSAFRFLPRSELLTFEEIERLASRFTALGVRKFRLTGGEPLLRRDLHKLVKMLAGIQGAEVTLTTNGSLLARQAEELAQAGLRRVTVSLDSLDPVAFARMTDSDFGVGDVLAGIERAARAGLRPIKINTVVRRGINHRGLVELARFFKGSGHIVRFIEFMDVGTENGWRLEEVVTAQEIIERLNRELSLEPIEPSYRGEVARRWRYRDGGGEIGVISSVSQPFCGDCTRARLASDGKLFTCLFATQGTDLRAPLRTGATDNELTELIADVWRRRGDRYSELRAEQPLLVRPLVRAKRVEMSYIGG
jgi:cyclic pyranopterin phosphate synthase